MDKVCKWCYSGTINKPIYQCDNRIDSMSLKWLGIKENDICLSCQTNIVHVTEYMTCHFVRRFDGWHNGKAIQYSQIPPDIKKLGWVAWLLCRLKEMLFSKYWKYRANKSTLLLEAKDE